MVIPMPTTTRWVASWPILCEKWAPSGGAHEGGGSHDRGDGDLQGAVKGEPDDSGALEGVSEPHPAQATGIDDRSGRTHELAASTPDPVSASPVAAALRVVECRVTLGVVYGRR